VTDAVSIGILQKKEPLISSPLLAALIIIFTEAMIFSSFISAFTILKSGFTNWPPMGQPRRAPGM
jgi:heme/copper-type cytochrome/quinol oxidase subunit 3